MRQGIRIALATVLMLLAVSAVAASRSQRRSLEDVQAAYAAAVRWNDFDTAQEIIDPQYRKEHPTSDLERARYEQVQISGYRELRAGNGANDNEVVRDVELRVINRNTQAERTVRVHETWRWDPQAKQWWLASGLPDLWRGE